MFIVIIVRFKAVDDSLSMKWKPGWINRLLKLFVKDAKALIIYLSLLFFIAVVRMELQSYTYIKYMYILPLLEVVGKCLHRSEYILRYLVVLGSTVVQYTTFVLILYSRSVSGGFSLVDFNTCILMCRCPIIASLDLSRCFLISFYVRPGWVFRETCLIALKRLAVVGLKSAACKYLASSGFEVCARMLFTTFSDCCGPRVIFHITVLFFMVPLIIYYPLFWMEISCLYSMTVHPS